LAGRIPKLSEQFYKRQHYICDFNEKSRNAKRAAFFLRTDAGRQKKNPYDGEEPGKIFHECPGVKLNGLSTLYAACDTTALFLIGHEIYRKLTGDNEFADTNETQIKAAKNYILSHLNKNNVFTENPAFCGSKKFALKRTYWKDSELEHRPNGEPDYPIVYSLAHAQNTAGLRCAAKLLGSQKLNEKAEKMKNALNMLYDKSTGCFYMAVDESGPVHGISSDSLHMLAYLSRGDISKNRLEAISKSSELLETPAGYRTLDSKTAESAKDSYHTKTVWPFEQAIINIGAKKFGLKHAEEVSSRITKYLADSDAEIFVLNREKITPGGCSTQLWTLAAKKYFDNPGKADDYM